MPTSEQVARGIYAGLDERDRRAVDAWKSLGNDLTTSLLNSGVLGSYRRRYPAEDLADWNRRMLGTDPDLILRETCEHEAAHAVVAQMLGLRGVEAVIEDDGASGVTRYEKTSARVNAIIAVASGVWIEEFRGLVFPLGAKGCSSDMRSLVVATGADEYNMREAQRRARLILAECREQVLTVADTLMRDRHVTLS